MAGIKGHYIYDKDGHIIGATGGKLAALTNKAKWGENFYSEVGKIGGAVKGVEKGFAANKELARSAGAKGGKASRRTWTDEQRKEHGIRLKEAWSSRHAN